MRVAIPLFAVLAAALAASTPALAQRPEIAGTWRIEVAWPEPIVLLSLVEEGDSVRGALLTDQAAIRLTSLARSEAGFDATVATRTREFALRAAVRGDSVTGEWTEGGRTGRLRGVRIPPTRQAPIAGTAVFDSVVRVLEHRFYDPGMNGADWPALVARLRPRAAAATSDGEAYGVIRELLAGIGGSHLGFSAWAASWGGGVAAAPGPIVSWRVLSPEVGYLHVRNFNPTGAAARAEFARLDSAFAQIGALPALILDLRANPGGSLDLAARLAQHLVARPTPGGYFVTQSGYTRRGLRTAQALDTATVPPLTASVGADGLTGAVEAAGGAAMVYVGGGGASAYAGKIAILTDRRTGSAAEAVAAALREVRGAVTVGERTAGAMLSSTEVGIAQGWMLRYPAMDYRTPSGLRVEGDGVPVDVPAPPAGEATIRAAAQALGHPLP